MNNSHVLKGAQFKARPNTRNAARDESEPGKGAKEKKEEKGERKKRENQEDRNERNRFFRRA